LNFSIFNFEYSAWWRSLVANPQRRIYISRIMARTGEICMISTFSQIVSSRPRPILDACLLGTLRAG
jgi:hypothetical protein